MTGYPTAMQSIEQRIAEDASLSLLQKVLLTTDGTVTQLLEIYTGQKISVRRLEHAMQSGGPAILSVSATEPVLSRRILLCGERPCMYAHSLLVPSRLPPGMQEMMMRTDTPMGQLWKAQKLETFREVVDYRREHDQGVAELLGSSVRLLSRSYLIHAGGAPLGLITEKFPENRFSQAVFVQ